MSIFDFGPVKLPGLSRNGPQVHLYGKNLEPEKYRHVIETMKHISGQLGYDIIHCNNDDMKPVNSLERDSQKIVTFDDFICNKNQKPLIDYFIQGRHKNCSVIYLSQSFYKTPKDIRSLDKTAVIMLFMISLAVMKEI